MHDVFFRRTIPLTPDMLLPGTVGVRGSYDHTTTAMHDMSTPRSLFETLPVSCAFSFNRSGCMAYFFGFFGISFLDTNAMERSPSSFGLSHLDEQLYTSHSKPRDGSFVKASGNGGEKRRDETRRSLSAVIGPGCCCCLLLLLLLLLLFFLSS